MFPPAMILPSNCIQTANPNCSLKGQKAALRIGVVLTDTEFAI